MLNQHDTTKTGQLRVLLHVLIDKAVKNPNIKIEMVKKYL